MKISNIISALALTFNFLGLSSLADGIAAEIVGYAVIGDKGSENVEVISTSGDRCGSFMSTFTNLDGTDVISLSNFKPTEFQQGTTLAFYVKEDDWHRFEYGEANDGEFHWFDLSTGVLSDDVAIEQGIPIYYNIPGKVRGITVSGGISIDSHCEMSQIDWATDAQIEAFDDLILESRRETQRDSENIKVVTNNVYWVSYVYEKVTEVQTIEKTVIIKERVMPKFFLLRYADGHEVAALWSRDRACACDRKTGNKIHLSPGEADFIEDTNDSIDASERFTQSELEGLYQLAFPNRGDVNLERKLDNISATTKEIAETTAKTNDAVNGIAEISARIEDKVTERHPFLIFLRDNWWWMSAIGIILFVLIAWRFKLGRRVLRWCNQIWGNFQRMKAGEEPIEE